MSVTEQKDLAYFERFPDEMPTDEASIEALLAGQSIGSTETNQDEIAAATSSSTGTNDDNGEGEGEGTTATDPKEGEGDHHDDEAPIATKDGKHTLPYSVLKSERERRQQAERMLEEMTSRIDSLQAQIQGNGSTEQVTDVPVISPEDMEALREDFPAFAQVLDQLTGKVSQLTQQLNVVTEREANAQREQQEKQAAKVRETVQESIEAVPALAYFQAEKPKMFDIAIAYDNEAKKDARFKGMNMVQRFEKVVELIEADYGKIEVPEAYTKGRAPAETELTPEQLADKAKAALKKVGGLKPRTLSDLPGGIPPASTPAESAERMSVGDLSAMMDRMTPEQINAFMAQTIR
jgi:DNA repair exonuclease SbcCD ATPase subunit